MNKKLDENNFIIFLFLQSVPPQYSLKNVNVPVALFYGKQDWLVTDKDFEYLKQNLPNVAFEHSIPSYGHLDFLLSKDVKDLVYNKLIELLNEL